MIPLIVLVRDEQNFEFNWILQQLESLVYVGSKLSYNLLKMRVQNLVT